MVIHGLTPYGDSGTQATVIDAAQDTTVLACAVAAFAMPANYAGAGTRRLPRHVRQGIVVPGWFRLVRLRK